MSRFGSVKWFTAKHLAGILYIRFTWARSKQQRMQGYGRVEALGLQPQSCRKSRRVAKRVHSTTSHVQSVKIRI